MVNIDFNCGTGDSFGVGWRLGSEVLIFEFVVIAAAGAGGAGRAAAGRELATRQSPQPASRAAW